MVKMTWEAALIEALIEARDMTIWRSCAEGTGSTKVMMIECL